MFSAIFSTRACVRAISAAFLASVLPMNAATIDLHTLDLTRMTAGWSAPKANRGVVSQSLNIGGRRYATGIGTHANSKFRIDLAGEARRFTAVVGVDDSAQSQGSVVFAITGDGKSLWQSKVLKGGQPAEKVDVDLAGVKILELRAMDAGDGNNHDHADWAEARLEMKDGAPAPKALPPFEQISLATKSFSIDFQAGEDDRLYQRPLGSAGSKDRPKRDDEAYPQAGDGYIWEPALQVTHNDGNTSTALYYAGSTRTQESPVRELIKIKLKDPAYPFEATLCFRVHKSVDVIEQWVELRHDEPGEVTLERMASSALAILPGKMELNHFHGDWANEMNPVAEPLTPGMKVLDSKIGVRAHQYRNPSFVLSLDGPANEHTGRILAGSLAWSGSFQCAFDHNGRTVRALCGINPFNSACHLKPGALFTTPVMIWAWSSSGLGGMSRNIHRWARDFGFRDGHTPREVLLNNWEATGFDFDFNRIAGLYAPAKAMGVELFLLDDGWFGNKYPRVNDLAGLGDWEPNRKRLPNGLAPLADAAIQQGMRFGIWIEPEMVNPKSELFEKHPDWAIRQPRRDLELQRNQLVLDITRPEVQEFEWKVIQDALGVPGVSYGKWDCNRYLTQPGSPWLSTNRQSHLWIDYVNALYALMNRTAIQYPKTELMLCSGGGGRVDYGALKYFHEFWPSDNTDPVRRVTMQWDYSYFFPAMTLSSHVTHWGKRPMHFACTVAMSARFGMDLDLARLSADDKAVCAGAISAYKKIREIVHLGELYRLERPHGAARGAINYVGQNGNRAAVFVFQLKNGPATAVKPAGLDPAKRYTLHELNPAPKRNPLIQEGKTLTGEEWMRVGITPSCVNALEACAMELSALQ